jgi:hypothetical protein
VFGGLPELPRFALAGDHDGAHAQRVQRIIDAGLAVAAVGGDRARPPAGAGDDPLDGGGELRRIRRVAPGCCWTRSTSSTAPMGTVTAIAKGRLGKPVEFGYKAQLVDNDDGVVLDHSLQHGSATTPPAASADSVAAQLARLKWLWDRR